MVGNKYFENFAKIFAYPRLFSYICGCDIFDSSYKIGWRTAFVFILTNVALYLAIHTVCRDVIILGDYYILLQSIATVGTGIQGYAKMVNIFIYQKNYVFLYKEITAMYATFGLKSVAYQECLKYNISLMKKLLLILCTITAIITVTGIALPMYSMLVLNVRLEIFSLRIPFLDFETDMGFYVTFATQFACLFFGVIGNAASDAVLFIYVAHIPLVKNILKCKFADLNKILSTYPRDVAKSREPLKEIFKWHQKYNTFCNTIKTSFFSVIFIQVSTEFFGIACTILCMFLGLWPIAPVYLFYLFSLVYAYCFLGNFVEMANDDVIDMIYDSCWYNLTVPEQKMILIMLRDAQQATGISIGGVAPLSMNTALQLTKTIYTMSMMLMEFLD